MHAGPDIARIAGLIGDRARAAMLSHLTAGRDFTATELARAARVTKQTTSFHLRRLVEGGLVAAESRGRHRYFRLTGPDVDDSRLVLDSEHAAEDDRDLLEFGPLARLLPASRRDHARNANPSMARVYASSVLLDPLRLRAGRLHDRRGLDELRHR